MCFSRVTIVKDKETRQSKGVAFVLFLDKESAQNCSRALNNKEVRLHRMCRLTLKPKTTECVGLYSLPRLIVYFLFLTTLVTQIIISTK